MKKKLFILLLLIIGLTFIATPKVKSQTGSYNSGDALYYRGAVYLTTINSGQAELFKVENKTITSLAKITAMSQGSTCVGFVDAVLNIEQRGLFLFLTDGKYIYKYSLNQPANPALDKKADGQANSKFIGLGKMDNKVYSVSDKGINVWDDDLRVFQSAGLTNAIPQNLKLSKRGGFIFNVVNNKLEIYDAYSQRLLSQANIKANDNHARNIYNDETDGTVYLVDDDAVKQFDFAGNLINSFNHTSDLGYDIAYIPGDDHLYFSDGIGIVKLRKSDLKPLSWIYTKNFSGANGWATGLKAVRDNYGEKIFIFEQSKINILDQDFKKVGSISLSNNNLVCNTVESLWLGLDKHRAAQGSEVSVSGRGFEASEDVSIYLADKKIDSAKTDSYGRLVKLIRIPALSSGSPNFMDIRLTGESSGKTYSTNFQIEKSGNDDLASSVRLSINKSSGPVGAEVLLKGWDFNPNEYVIIYLADKRVALAKTDYSGRFSATIIIPDLKPGRTEIKVFGENLGGIGQSIDFRVERSGINNSTLSTNKSHAAVGSEVILSGWDFNPNEYVIIYLADKRVALARADNNGSFITTIIIPQLKSGWTEIKVTGESLDCLNQSIDFIVD